MQSGGEARHHRTARTRLGGDPVRIRTGNAVVLDPGGLRSGQAVGQPGLNRIRTTALSARLTAAPGAPTLGMQKLAEICIRRPVFAAMIVLTLVVVGAAGYIQLGVDRFPSVDLPTVRINTRLPGASPAEMESQVSQPIEEVVNTVEGIKELRSINGMGSCFVVVTFDLNRDIDSATQDVRDRVSTVLRDLPRDVDPPTIAKSDTDQSPMLSLSLSGPRSQRELTEMADKIVKMQIERSLGRR